MIAIDIPGFGRLQLEHLVADYNGTLALDGQLLPGVAERLASLAARLHVHVITADTFGVAKAQLAGLPVALTITPAASQAEAKQRFVDELGAQKVVAIGNGRNDCLMLQAAALGIALIQREGAAPATIAGAHVLCTGVLDALDLLVHPKRLIATLRS